MNLGSLAERKDDDLSLIVHVDDTQNDLDNDILGTPMRNATNDVDMNADETKEGQASTGDKTEGDAEKTGEASSSGDNKENTASSSAATPPPSSSASTSQATDAQKKEGSSSASSTAAKSDEKKESSSSSSEKTKRLVCMWQAVVSV